MLLYLVVSFIHQVNSSRQQLEDLDRIEQNIAVELEESKELERLREYVESAEAIDWWARTNGWGKQDEVVIAAVGGSREPAPAGSQTTRHENAGTEPPVDVWWDLFFGTR
jgi:hypothetical protein